MGRYDGICLLHSVIWLPYSGPAVVSVAASWAAPCKEHYSSLISRLPMHGPACQDRDAAGQSASDGKRWNGPQMLSGTPLIALNPKYAQTVSLILIGESMPPKGKRGPQTADTRGTDPQGLHLVQIQIQSIVLQLCQHKIYFDLE